MLMEILVQFIYMIDDCLKYLWGIELQLQFVTVLAALTFKVLTSRGTYCIFNIDKCML